jgi:hypothetical protein
VSAARGSCLCGAVRFELTDPPVKATWCHCSRCRKRTGVEGSAQARVEPGSVRIVAGEDRVRAYAPPDGFEKLFCGDCGGALFSRERGGEIWSVRLGAFDEDPGVRPSHRQWTSSAVDWLPIPDDDLPRFERFGG